MKKGFSLVEILVVITIIGLLSATATISFERQRARSRDAKRIADVSNLGIGVEGYKSITGQYPSDNNAGSTGVEITAPLAILVTNGLLNTLPSEPQPIPNGISGRETFCNNYAYKKVWTGSGDSLVTNIGGTATVGTRAYNFYFSTEVAATSDFKHVLNKDIPATTGLTWCNGKRGYAYLLGPRI